MTTRRKIVAAAATAALAASAAAAAVLAIGADPETVTVPADPPTAWGVWPSGRGSLSAAQETDRLEGVVGEEFDVYRVRHGDGLDAPGGFAIDDPLAVAAANAGYMNDFRIHAYRGTITGGTRAAIPWGQITAGQWDATIRERAQELKAYVDTYGRTYLTFQHEADIDDSVQPSGCSLADGTNAACGPQFKTLYSYVRAIFLEELGASNARVVWVANLTRDVYDGLKGSADNWIGGPAYDEVGVDGYNRADCGGTPWTTFADLFDTAHAYAVVLDKPLNIGEVGSVEDHACAGAQTLDPANAKAEWFRAARDQVEAWGNVSLVNWNHSTDGSPDWFLDTSAPVTDGARYVLED